jgi:hypothetical protein
MSGADVVLEESNDTGENGVVVTRVTINGVDVGRLAKTPKIDIGTRGNDKITTVTITLLPSRLVIKGEHADDDRREPRVGFTVKIN